MVSCQGPSARSVQGPFGITGKYGVQGRRPSLLFALVLCTLYSVLGTQYFTRIPPPLFFRAPLPPPKRPIGVLVGVACRASAAATLLALAASLPAAEKPATAKSDPILADLKTTARADSAGFCPPTVVGGALVMDIPSQPQPKSPRLSIVVELRGTAAAQASSFGEVKVASLLDGHGKSYRWACVPQWPPGNDMVQILRGFTGLPDKVVLLYLTIPNRPPIESIRELQGAWRQTGGERETVTVRNAFRRLETLDEKDVPVNEWARPIRDRKPIRDKGLDGHGIQSGSSRTKPSIVRQRDKDVILIGAESHRFTILDCEIKDSKGTPIPEAFPLLRRRKRSWSATCGSAVVAPPTPC